MTALILIYLGLLIIIWIGFKLSNRKNNPFKIFYFWMTLILSVILVTVLLGYWSLRNFYGRPPKEGWNRTFYKNGKLEKEFFVSNGKIEGYFKTYYSNGQREFLLKYKNGFQIDTSYIFYETGKVSKLEVYKDKKLINEINYYKNGIKESESYTPIETSKYNYHITYYSNGNKEFETRINNKNYEGNGFYYYTNGKIKLAGKYKEGQENGVWQKFDSLTGKVIDVDTFNYKNNPQFKPDW